VLSHSEDFEPNLLAVTNIEIVTPDLSSDINFHHCELKTKPSVEYKETRTMRDIHPDIELMEQDENVRRVVSALCPKVRSHFELKREGDFTSLLNSLSNLTD